MKRVIAVLDLPPKQAHASTRASYASAAQRWQAELLWITRPLADRHPFWQKMLVAEHVQSKYGACRVAQLDNDMLIRSDCPSPFDAVSSDKFGIVPQRGGPWTRRSHVFWADRSPWQPAPRWFHVQGGLMVYPTSDWVAICQQCFACGPGCNWNSRYGCDEPLLSNLIWQHHRDRIQLLPQTFNTLVSQCPRLAEQPTMEAHVYHFHTWAKKHLPKIDWKPVPELQNQSDKLADLFTQHGSDKNTDHSYGDFYQRVLAGVRPKRILEFGVKGAASVKAWLDAYPDAEVVGVDTHPTDFRHPRFIFIHTDQSDVRWIVGQQPFDVIVDDASHQFADQIDTLCKFWPALNPGGHYCIEDIRAYQTEIPLHWFDVIGGEVHSFLKNGRHDDILWHRQKQPSDVGLLAG